MTHYRPYIIAYAIFLICLFTSPYLYSFFDFHVSDAYEHYELDRKDWERQNPGEISYMSYPEWQQRDDDQTRGFFNEFANQCAMSFDPWFEPQYNNERGND